MKNYHPHFSAFVASPREEPAVEESVVQYSEEQLIERAQAIKALNKEIALECERAATLESMIETVNNTESPLTAFQVTMLQHAARNAKTSMAHTALGFGMEAYQGYRGRQLLHISVESFSDVLKQVIAKIIALFERLKSWIKDLLLHRSTQARVVLSELAKPRGKAKMSPELKLKVANLLAVGNEVKPEVVAANSLKVLKGVTDNAYINEVASYSDKVSHLVQELVKPDINWRTAAKPVNTVSFPVPREGFDQFSSMGQKATYRSLPLAGNSVLQFDNTPKTDGGGVEGGNDGVRGARARAEELASAGTVQTLVTGEYAGHADEDLKGLSDAQLHAAKEQVTALMKQVLATERVTGVLFVNNQRHGNDLTRFVEHAGEQKPDVISLTSKLITSIARASTCASNLIDKATDVSLRTGRAFAAVYASDLT